MDRWRRFPRAARSIEVTLARPRARRRAHARLPARRDRVRRDVARLSRGARRRDGVRRARLQPRRIRRLHPVPLPRPLTYMHDEGFLALPELLDAAGVRQAFLVGHSDGGSIALLHASMPRSLPRVRGLLLEAPHVFCEEITVRAIGKARDEHPHRPEGRSSNGTMAETSIAPSGAGNRAWLDPGFLAWNIEQVRAFPPSRSRRSWSRGSTIRTGPFARSKRSSGNPADRSGVPHPRAVRPHPASRAARPYAFGDGRVPPRDPPWEHPVKRCRPLRRRCRASFTIATPSRSRGELLGKSPDPCIQRRGVDRQHRGGRSLPGASPRFAFLPGNDRAARASCSARRAMLTSTSSTECIVA